MTFLNDSSDWFNFCSMALLEAMAAGDERFLVWEIDRRLDLAWWWMVLMAKSQQNPPYFSRSPQKTPLLQQNFAEPQNPLVPQNKGFYLCGILLNLVAMECKVVESLVRKPIVIFEMAKLANFPYILSLIYTMTMLHDYPKGKGKEAMAAGDARFLVWEIDRRLDLAWWWMVLMA
ncbi:hypothetical protein OSB04_022478 [Centaurea solstitialis]|uniref:Uncharacterized protein n=1 Tax=Centaurea solstitialis TaxID=347529 RepID=A0AA38WF75_9ASTR|nr:hypothetical protein OSB04_022478 [Centaurea solstitialis]